LLHDIGDAENCFTVCCESSVMSASSDHKCKWKNQYPGHNNAIKRIPTQPISICDYCLSIVNVTYTLFFNDIFNGMVSKLYW
jgi:hypothetical protein